MESTHTALDLSTNQEPNIEYKYVPIDLSVKNIDANNNYTSRYKPNNSENFNKMQGFLHALYSLIYATAPRYSPGTDWGAYINDYRKFVSAVVTMYPTFCRSWLNYSINRPVIYQSLDRTEPNNVYIHNTTGQTLLSRVLGKL